MKFQIALLAIMALAELSSAQLLPPQKEEPTTEQPNTKSNRVGFDIKSSLIWTGLCATEAILSKGASANSLCLRGQP